MLLLIALASITACATFVNDPAPPTNVRSSPNGNVVGTLDNGQRLTVTDDRGGWLRISAPTAGWVHLSVTKVRCGEDQPGKFSETIHAIDALGSRAHNDWLAADLLVRYALTTDGAPGEAASGEVGDLMQANPKRAIAALDQIPEGQRRELLRSAIGLSRDPAATVQSFKSAVSAQPSAPTSRTWSKLLAVCDPALRSYLGC